MGLDKFPRNGRFFASNCNCRLIVPQFIPLLFLISDSSVACAGCTPCVGALYLFRDKNLYGMQLGMSVSTDAKLWLKLVRFRRARLIVGNAGTPLLQCPKEETLTICTLESARSHFMQPAPRSALHQTAFFENYAVLYSASLPSKPHFVEILVQNFKVFLPYSLPPPVSPFSN